LFGDLSGALSSKDFPSGMALPQRIFPAEKIFMDWQQRQRPGAGLFNLGNTCYINVILQCLTYTPPLANYLLSHKHSQSDLKCKWLQVLQQVFFVFPSSRGELLNSFLVIGEEFEYGRQENAYEFLRCTLSAMHRACLSTHRGKVAWPSWGKIRCISALGCVLGFRCKKKVPASKKVTVHHAPRVLTLCLERADQWTGTKISKFVEYPEYLDLRPYMSDTAGEPLLCSLYAIVVHSGDTCLEGHFFCYTKASNGLWYKMDDESVDNCDIHTVLGQQAYLLFYLNLPLVTLMKSSLCCSKKMTESQRSLQGMSEAAITLFSSRCSDLKMRETTASSSAPPYAHSIPGQGGASHQQTGSPGPQSLPGRIKVMHSQRSCAKKRARSRSPQWGNDLCSWIVNSTNYSNLIARKKKRTSPLGLDCAPRNATAPGPSNGICQQAAVPSFAWVQTLSLLQRGLGRSSWQDYGLWIQVVEITNSYQSVRRSEHPRDACQTNTVWMVQQHSI
uniref:USP domain-containing protein n=1 Tax=Cyanoderma ruficeps TaxID=181631 RepID=A0A8C3XBD1_9PASS